MDANTLRYLLIILAGSLAVSLNVPWRHTGRSLIRCMATLATPSGSIATHRSGRGMRLASLPWNEIASARHEAVCLMPQGGTRRYALARVRVPR